METLTIIIYVCLIALIIVLIAIGIRVLGTLHRVNDLLDDITVKVHSFDKLFEIIDTFNDKMSAVGDAVVGFISGGVKRLFKERKKSVKKEE